MCTTKARLYETVAKSNMEGNKIVVETDLQSIGRVLARHPHIRLAILFGPAAANKQRLDSDVDLAVAADHPLDSDERFTLVAELAEATGRPVDLVDLAKAGEPLLGQIITKGRRLVDDELQYARLLSKHLLDQADCMPYRKRILDEWRQAWIGK